MKDHLLAVGQLRWTTALAVVLWLLASPVFGAAPRIDYLSDRPELLLRADQSWGELGYDVAAHAPNIRGLPLRLGTHTYSKGLGHHANGSLTFLLNGEFVHFDAVVGVQKQESRLGSVGFRVYVDGTNCFDSGVLRQEDAPRQIHVSVKGAQELRLESCDAGDGFSCDMANWAEARLTRDPSAKERAQEPGVDIAPFARVVSWDANRMDGARASRIEEFRAEDVFLETELPNQGAGFKVPAATNGLGCIGLQWLNQRAIKFLVLELTRASGVPATNAVQLQAWFGESAWQGQWKTVPGQLKISGRRFEFLPNAKSPEGGLFQTRKIRWLLPATSKPILVKQLSAFTRSSWETLNVYIESENRVPTNAEVRVLNGEAIGWVDPRWRLTQPLHLNIRYSRPGGLQSDPTVLTFKMPSGACGVAVADLLTNPCVYVPDLGLFVAREPLKTTLAEYKKKIAQRTTTLQRVRELPDQTLAQAMAKTHHDVQKSGPVLLSLSCDNTKFIVERSGDVLFQSSPESNPPWQQWSDLACSIRPQFGSTALKEDQLARRLDRWIPMPIITGKQDGIIYTERAFVAPTDPDGENPTRLNRRSVFVAEFSVTNAQASPAQAALSMNLLANNKRNVPATIQVCGRGFLMLVQGKPVALIDTQSMPLGGQVENQTVRWAGSLPPHRAAKCVVYVAGVGETLNEDVSWQSETLLPCVERYWNAVLGSSLQVQTPDPFLNNIIRASQIRCLIDSRNEAKGARIAPWIAAMTYGPLESEAHSIIRGMDLMGHGEFARRGLDYYVQRYNREGFLTTGYTVFGTGWHLWTLGEHFELNRDRKWLQRVAPEITRVGEWIVRQTEKARQIDYRGNKVPEFGLMPPGVMADWNAYAYHYCLNAYYYAALREIGAALKEIRAPEGAVFLRKASELQENLLRAYAWTQAQTPVLPLGNGTWVPAYPSQVHSPGKLAEYFPGQDAGRSWCYDVELGAHQLVPAGVLPPGSREVSRMLDHMEDVQFLAEGWFDYPASMNAQDWFNNGGFSKVQPYYTRNGEIYAMRDEVKPFLRSYFNTIAAMLNPEVLTFWEHFNRSGAWDKTHETGYFLQQTRFMLVTERGEELWLAPMLTSNWLKDGQSVTVQNAPTRFGKVGYRITSHVAQNFIEAQIAPPRRGQPSMLVLRLRHPEGKLIKSVRVNGRPHTSFQPTREIIRLQPSRKPMVVRAIYAKD